MEISFGFGCPLGSTNNHSLLVQVAKCPCAAIATIYVQFLAFDRQGAGKW
jgi:hypothetical protein